MSLMRSPTKGASATGNSSSFPDLTNISAVDMDTKNVVVRKRKTPDNDFAHEFNAFKKEILDILKESNRCQLENMNTIGHSISSINEQLKEMKITTEQLISENGLLKSQITTLNNTVKVNEENITLLQTEIKQLKSNARTSQAPERSLVPMTTCDDAITELQERAERNCPVIKKALRLGKYDAEKTRPLKICFDSHETVKTILRNRSNYKQDGVRFFSDQTPYQQKFLAKLIQELHQREEAGETNLIIKYIKGTPKIVKTQPKN
ncbi:unnamed protein product [Euphydryas editha]|uniref:Uncharacterized protein n=1 Tax=Euphydryas editha TaxID=104508 RepID=A0AAU9UZS5_EUPED|nr:unnamed protein product [Euphydryas editha]